MLQIVSFISSAIVNFIGSLDSIMILDSNMSLLGFFISLLAARMIFSFIYDFFKFERRYREKEFRNKMKNKNNYLVYQSRKYLKKNKL